MNINMNESIKKITLGIIGGGASGIILAYNLVKYTDYMFNIVIYDHHNFQGGLAYSTKNDNHILNMKPSLMSGDICDSLHFENWLYNIKLYPKDQSYPPRHMYKKYLDNLLLYVKNKSQGQNLNFKMLNEYAKDIEIDNSKYLVKTELTSSTFDAIVIAIGHNKPKTVYNSDDIIAYQFDKLPRVLGGRVGIIGSGLTAIDAVVEVLSKPQSQETVFCFSDTGLLPAVQPCGESIVDENFGKSLDNYVSSNKKINYARIYIMY